MAVLWEWLINLPIAFSEFFTWLTTPLEVINLPPLALFSFAGISIIIGALLVRLFVGG